MSQVNLGDLDTFTVGEGARVDVEDERIAVFRVGDDVYAIGDRCSHAEASLSEGEVFDREIECPRHGAEFDIRTGRPLSLPATKPVRTYPTEVLDGEVLLTINEASE
jgi:3-phenylpropionate/trans-cinnamate dioxygenase ferredoxin subunit